MHVLRTLFPLHVRAVSPSFNDIYEINPTIFKQKVSSFATIIKQHRVMCCEALDCSLSDDAACFVHVGHIVATVVRRETLFEETSGPVGLLCVNPAEILEIDPQTFFSRSTLPRVQPLQGEPVVVICTPSVSSRAPACSIHSKHSLFYHLCSLPSVYLTHSLTIPITTRNTSALTFAQRF